MSESSTSYNTKETKYNKEFYTDGLKSTRRKVSFVAVFTDITSRGALPEEASIHTVEMAAMIEIQMREDMRWVI